METGTRVKIINQNKINMLKYLFYRIYIFQKNIIGTDLFESAFVSVISISWYAAMNIISVILFFNNRYKIFIKLESLGRWTENIIFGTFAVILMTIFYFILFHKKKYLKIINEIENKSKKENRKGNIIAIIYQIISFIFFIFSLIYNDK